MYGTIGAFRSQRLAVNNDSNSSSANMDSPLTPWRCTRLASLGPEALIRGCVTLEVERSVVLFEKDVMV